MAGEERERLCSECGPTLRRVRANGRFYRCPKCGCDWQTMVPKSMGDEAAWAMRSTLSLRAREASACSHYDAVRIDANAAHFLASRQMEALATAGYRIRPTAIGLRNGFGRWLCRRVNYRLGELIDGRF